jgi:SAM-dependent methyltransferase
MPTTGTTGRDAADTELKARHRRMWASGDYPAIAREMVEPLGPRLVEALDVQAGEQVLDVAAGTGNAAIPAAERGANVVASDLTPELFVDGRARARERGCILRWEEADAERLPYPDGAFDVVMSAIGAMFAPRHDVVAAELLRVCRPGGRIGMVNWTPEGLIGEVFRTMAPYMPPPPPGASPPPLWGSEEHVRSLLGPGVADLRMVREMLVLDQFASPAAYRDFFRDRYGPTIVAYANAGDRAGELDAAFLALAERADRGGEGGSRFEQEYLVVTAVRR